MPRFTLSTLLAVAAAFLAGLAIGRYTIPHLQNRSAPVSLQINSLGENSAPVRLIGPAAATPFPLASAQPGSAPVSAETIIAGLKNAMAGPSDRHSYLEASKLIDGIDPKNMRPVIDAIQALPNQREKSIYLACWCARWAEGEPQAALAYAQTTGPASDRRLMVSAAVRAWAEKDATAANAWVLQLPPGPGTRLCLAGGRLVVSRNRSAGRAYHAANTPHGRPESAKFLLADLFPLGEHRSGDGRATSGAITPGIRA